MKRKTLEGIRLPKLKRADLLKRLAFGESQEKDTPTHTAWQSVKTQKEGLLLLQIKFQSSEFGGKLSENIEIKFALCHLYTHVNRSAGKATANFAESLAMQTLSTGECKRVPRSAGCFFGGSDPAEFF